jgi:hypothetical protein
VRFFLSPAFALLLVAALWLSVPLFGFPHWSHAEPPVSLPRPAATQPSGPLYIVRTECVLYVTWSDGETTRRTIESHVGH